MLKRTISRGVLFIQNGDFYFEIEDSEKKMMKETPYELLKDYQKKQLGKNNKAKMTLYITLPRKEAKVKAIEEAKDLDTLPLEELIGNLKVYGMILASDGVASKPIKEKVMPIALKANVTRGQTSNDSVCQDGSDEDEDEEEEFNSIVKNLWKLFKKSNRFERENRFGNGGDRFDRGHGNSSKGVGSFRGKCNCYVCGSKNHFVDCTKENMKKAFFGRAWSDSAGGDQMEKDATCLMAIGLQKVNLNPYQFDNNVNELKNNYYELVKMNFKITKTNESLLKEKSTLEQEKIRFINKINELELEVKKFNKAKEVVEPCLSCEKLTQEVDYLKCNVSKLQEESLSFSKFKRISSVLDDMLSHQKLSQDKEGLGFPKTKKNTSESLSKPIVNGYLRKGRKTKPKRQNWTRNGKAGKDKVKVQAQA
ncbi:hypothetical protein Tco_1120693 [Tanacetum coccineum]